MARKVEIKISPNIEAALARYEELCRILDCGKVAACSFDFGREFTDVLMVLGNFFAGQVRAV